MGGYQGRRLQAPPRRRAPRYQGRRVQSASPGHRPPRRQGRRVLPSPRWRRPVLLLLTAVLLDSCGFLSRDLVRAHQERAAYRALAQKVHETPGPSPAGEGPAQPPYAAAPEASAPETETLSPYQVLAQENPDLAGGLSIEDTAID